MQNQKKPHLRKPSPSELRAGKKLIIGLLDFKRKKFKVEPARQLEYAVADRLKVAGATQWKWPDYIWLCNELGCTPELLAVACGCTDMHENVRVARVKDWKRRGIPGTMALTCAIIKQFVIFKKTGVLSPPIIPLDVLATNLKP